jgi:hypothetical protein
LQFIDNQLFKGLQVSITHPKKVRSTITFVENAIPNRVLEVRSTVTFIIFYQYCGARQYLRYYNQRIRFEVKSNGSGTVVPIVVEIPHNGLN